MKLDKLFEDVLNEHSNWLKTKLQDVLTSAVANSLNPREIHSIVRELTPDEILDAIKQAG